MNFPRIPEGSIIRLLSIIFLFCALSVTAYLLVLAILSESHSQSVQPQNQGHNESPSPVAPLLPASPPVIHIYFCPHDDCQAQLFSLLQSANTTIHCATYELNLPRIKSLLANKSITLDVRLVVDNEYYDEVQELRFTKMDGTSGLMHDKFCVVDGHVVYSGSMNPTVSCTTKNNNNLLIIDSAPLAANYEAEFAELWQGTFGRGTPTLQPVISSKSPRLESYFCPEDRCVQRVRQEIARANKSIYFMEFSFTEPAIASDLILKHLAGVDVKGVFEKTQISTYSKYWLLTYQGMDVRNDTNKYKMHHKVWMIDNRTVITGSFNPSENADKRNDENILIIEDPKTTAQFLEEFEQVWPGDT